MEAILAGYATSTVVHRRMAFGEGVFTACAPVFANARSPHILFTILEMPRDNACHGVVQACAPRLRGAGRVEKPPGEKKLKSCVHIKESKGYRFPSHLQNGAVVEGWSVTEPSTPLRRLCGSGIHPDDKGTRNAPPRRPVPLFYFSRPISSQSCPLYLISGTSNSAAPGCIAALGATIHALCFSFHLNAIGLYCRPTPLPSISHARCRISRLKTTSSHRFGNQHVCP